MPTSVLLFIGVVVLVFLLGGWRLVVLERRKIDIDRKAVALHREGQDHIWRGLLQDAADLARVGTPEALAGREVINRVIRRMEMTWARSEKEGRPVDDPEFLAALAAALQAREHVLSSSTDAFQDRPTSDPQTPERCLG
jgi:hypothetical protein